MEVNLSKLSMNEQVGVLKWCLGVTYDEFADYYRKEMARRRRPYKGLRWGPTEQQTMIWRWETMLNFKNKSGEIVMTEKDNGKLSIHDEVLKESLEQEIELAEARKNVDSRKPAAE